MPTIDEVTRKYIELRDRKKEIADRQTEELKPLNDAMTTIENWMLEQMTVLGVDSFKTEFGTPYKAKHNSVTVQDPVAFKKFVLDPAAEAVRKHLISMGYHIDGSTISVIENIIRDMARWDMVDFRVGKKGVLEHLENTSQLPPGVALNSVFTVNIRRS